MTKITVVGAELSADKKARLEALGEVKYLPSPTDSEALVAAAEGADVLYSDGARLLESLPKLRNVFVVYPFVELGVFDSEALKANGVTVANSQGGNRASIIEWVMFMVLSLFRGFVPQIRATENISFAVHESLAGKKACIVGKGSIGSQIAGPCEAFGMDVRFFERGDDLIAKASDVDLVINALNCNSSSEHLLDETFFRSLKPGAYFITFARQYTYDLDSLLAALDDGIVAGAAIDCDPEKFGDTTNAFYQKALSNPKVLVTPHVAWSTAQALANGSEIAVKNIEAFLSGAPQNVLRKR
ncbi:MAG: hypothetical protein HGB37_01015 [Candidatus Moranbacteria bacterium]|nr:hypothetical protein [Candidatus Moranbacteria bacterium]